MNGLNIPRNFIPFNISPEESKHLETDTSIDVSNDARNDESKMISMKELNPTINQASSQQLSSEFQNKYENLKRIEHEMTMKYSNKQQLMKNLKDSYIKNQTMKSTGIRYKFNDKVKEYEQK